MRNKKIGKKIGSQNVGMWKARKLRRKWVERGMWEKNREIGRERGRNRKIGSEGNVRKK